MPPHAAELRQIPVVLNFHGGGGHGASEQQYSLMDQLADQLLHDLAIKMNKTLIVMAAEGAIDEVASKAGAAKVINPRATGGVVYMLVDVIEGTNMPLFVAEFVVSVNGDNPVKGWKCPDLPH